MWIRRENNNNIAIQNVKWDFFGECASVNCRRKSPSAMQKFQLYILLKCNFGFSNFEENEVASKCV